MVSADISAPADLDAELPVRLEMRRRDVAAERRLHDGVDVAGVEPVARGPLAIDLDVEVGLAQHAEDAKVGHARHLAHHALHLGWRVLRA